MGGGIYGSGYRIMVDQPLLLSIAGPRAYSGSA
jgi:hypothetical protein